MPAQAWPRRPQRPDTTVVMTEPLPRTPAVRLQELADEIGAALEYMTARFGPPALKTLTVSPVPASFGQGFPGLIYLSTLSYLGTESKPITSLREYQQLFFSEILSAHETAHQWWGNVVTSATYHDEWLMEALANYSALLYLERRKGARALELILDEYRNSLLSKTPNGRVIDSVGPIVLGARLRASPAPQAWETITYRKGSWIVHMLRRLMGDEQFSKMLGELRRRYEWKGISTEQFRALAVEFLPPKMPDPKLEVFFDQWVYGTGIPSLEMKYSVRGKPPAVRVTGTVTQTGVGAHFSALVPVEIQVARGKSVIQWVQASAEPAPFSVSLKQAPLKVQLDPNFSVLTGKK